MMMRRPDSSAGKNIGGANKMRKGLWSPEEDDKLINYMLRNGQGCWSEVARNAGLQRCGKSCRLRWINYLRPDLKRGAFSPQEEELIIHLHSMLGNRWSQIAARLPGRTDNEIKNFWNSTIKKRLKTSSSLSPSPNSTTELSSLPEAAANDHHYANNLMFMHSTSAGDTGAMFQDSLGIYSSGYLINDVPTAASMPVGGNGTNFFETNGMCGGFNDDKVGNIKGIGNFWVGDDQEMRIGEWDLEELMKDISSEFRVE